MTKYFIKTKDGIKEIRGTIFVLEGRWFGLSKDGNVTDLLSGLKAHNTVFPTIDEAISTLDEDLTALTVRATLKEKEEVFAPLLEEIKACYPQGSAMYKRLYGRTS